MNRADTARLADLRDEAELAELEIKTLTAKDFATLDSSKLTAGQIIVLADLIDAFTVIRGGIAGRVSDAVASSVPSYEGDYYASPLTSETRSDFASATASYASEPDQSTESRREEMLARIKALLSGSVPPDTQIQTVGGPVRYADIPKDEDGKPSESWVEANCTCDDHERKRIEADRNSADVDPFAFAPGQYL